jgi:hypothetical protein
MTKSEEVILDTMKRALSLQNTNQVASFELQLTGQKFYILTQAQLERLSEGKLK